MSSSTYFDQVCPTCGRRLMIRVEYLGKRVACQHCRGQFKATDGSYARFDDEGLGSELLRRAEELLQSGTRRRVEPPTESPHPR